MASAKDANILKNRFSKITSDIIECAAASGLENSGSMEDAIHAVVSLAVKGQKGNITGDEAKNWYGEGWELLSEQCQDYLQTAAAFEKLSELSETADYAPIVIEYCRAVELETNNVVIKPYMQSLKDKNYQENDFYKNKAADYFKDVIARFSDDSKPSSMMLGEIGTRLSYASSSYSDKDIFSTLQQYCIKCGRLHLLDSVTVGKYRLIGKIRNQSAHPLKKAMFGILATALLLATFLFGKVNAEDNDDSSQCDANIVGNWQIGSIVGSGEIPKQ